MVWAELASLRLTVGQSDNREVQEPPQAGGERRDGYERDAPDP